MSAATRLVGRQLAWTPAPPHLDRESGADYLASLIFYLLLYKAQLKKMAMAEFRH